MNKKNETVFDCEKNANKESELQRIERLELELKKLLAEEELSKFNHKNNERFKSARIEQTKVNFYLVVLLLSLMLLAIGWFPTGKTFEAIQKAYVELIVNLPKMIVLASGIICAFKAAKHFKNKDL